MIPRAALIFVFGTICGSAANVTAQTSAAGARDAALAGAGYAAPSTYADLWSESNPSNWSGLEGFAAGIHVARLHGLDELRLGAVQAGVDLRQTAIVAGARTFGFSDYRETIFTAGAARAIRWGTHRPIHLGVRLRYHRTAIRTYGSASTFALSAGIRMPVAPAAEIGLSAENVYVLPGALNRELPRRLHAGISVAAGSVILMAGASKEVRTPLAARFGIEIVPVDAVVLRAGYALEPPRFASGIGLRLRPLTVDVAAERHGVLGWTPSCSVGLRW